MRNGDLYKMQALLKHGTPMETIVQRYGRWYSEEEIRSFLQPKPKRRRKKVTDDVGSTDLQPGLDVTGG